jgi:3-isopropylmalate dehydratase
VAYVDERVYEDEHDKEVIADQPEDNAPHTNTSAPQQSSSSLPKFEKLRGIAAPLDKSNVDTDAIIPKQFLKTIKRTGLGKALFHGWRYNEDDSEKPDFVLNQEPYRQARILVCTGPNFGCGSSREHAPWALNDFGIKCVIAPSFADIFFNNMFKNGMLPVAITNKADLESIADVARAGKEVEVDLEDQVVRDSDGNKLCSFEVEEFRRHCLLNGLDDIGLTMQLEEKIALFEIKMSKETPWLDGRGYLKRKGRSGQLAVKPVKLPTTNRGEPKAVADW